MHRRAAERINTDLHAGAADRLQINNVWQIGRIAADIIVAVNAVGRDRTRVGHAAHIAQFVSDELIGEALNPSRCIDICRTAIRRIVFEAAILRRIVRRRDHNAVGQA